MAMASSRAKFVLWIASSTPTACEIFAQSSGADVILIDAQHGAFGHDEAIKLVAAAALGKAECAVRASDFSSAAEICRYLDAGATTVVCPLVNDRAACETFVKSCY
jgi:4-hydroxy-2-oxoheptanedioate aldolase